jgi:hypothetical protein
MVAPAPSSRSDVQGDIRQIVIEEIRRALRGS